MKFAIKKKIIAEKYAEFHAKSFACLLTKKKEEKY